MYQGINLNFSDQPQRRAQVSPGPNVLASGGSVAAVQGDIAALDVRVTALEGQFALLGDFADDAAAATGGVAVGGLYRNGSVLMVRVA